MSITKLDSRNRLAIGSALATGDAVGSLWDVRKQDDGTILLVPVTVIRRLQEPAAS